MKFCLQFGFGMMEHSRTLVQKWGGGTVILSPRDLNGEQLIRLSAQITQLPGGKVLLDPQLYLPRADHSRLLSHDYWPRDYATGAFWTGPGLSDLVTKITALNRHLNTISIIAPGLLATSLNADWLAVQEAIVARTKNEAGASPVLATIALSADVLKSEDQIADLLESSASWEAEGYYIVAEHPSGAYIVENPAWLANLLDLIAGLRLQRKWVLLGYCNQQMLISSAAKVDAIASGTWMNVRSFPPDKFRQAYDDEIKQRATWYYCPQALSEYKLPFLDVANRTDCLDLLVPEAEVDGGYTEDLFDITPPTSSRFSERDAFRHYLHSLHEQARLCSESTFDATLDKNERMLDSAETLLTQLRQCGVRGQHRDFSNAVDVNRAALAVLRKTRGAILRRKWSKL